MSAIPSGRNVSAREGFKRAAAVFSDRFAAAMGDEPHGTAAAWRSLLAVEQMVRRGVKGWSAAAVDLILKCHTLRSCIAKRVCFVRATGPLGRRTRPRHRVHAARLRRRDDHRRLLHLRPALCSPSQYIGRHARCSLCPCHSSLPSNPHGASSIGTGGPTHHSRHCRTRALSSQRGLCTVTSELPGRRDRRDAAPAAAVVAVLRRARNVEFARRRHAGDGGRGDAR
jgi:hypothetical protein